MSCGPILSVSLHLAFPLHLSHSLSRFWVNRKFYKKSSGGLSHVPLWTGDEQSRTWTMFQGLTWLCWDICEPVKHLSLPPHPSEHHLARLLTCTLHRSSSNQQCRRSLICTALSCLLQHFLWASLENMHLRAPNEALQDSSSLFKASSSHLACRNCSRIRRIGKVFRNSLEDAGVSIFSGG